MAILILNTWSKLKENKLLFLLSVTVQLLFFALLSVALFNYSQSIVGPLENINNEIMSQKWMQEMPTEENLRDLGIPGTDVAAIEAEKQKMENATIRLYASIVALFVLCMGLVAVISYRIALKLPWKEAAKKYWRFAMVALIGLCALFLLIHSTIILLAMQFFTPNASQTYLFMLPLFIAAIVMYFLPVSFAVAGRVPLKEVLGQTIHVGIKRCVFLFSFYGLVGLIAVGLTIALFKAANVSFVLSIIVALLLLTVMAFSRIALIAELQENINDDVR